MKLHNVTKRYGEKLVLENLTLEFPEKKITAVLGASGIGKTTLLNILAGIVDFDGAIDRKADEIAYLYQEQRLLPHLSVEKNLEYVLRHRIKNKTERQTQIVEMLEKVGLCEDRSRYPAELSGGMGQRLAMARAFLVPGDLLLMDEPFKELDYSLKKRMFALFRSLFEEKPRTTVFVTHDLEDALRLADKAVVLGQLGARLFEKDLSPSPELRTETENSVYREEIYELL